MRLQIERRVGTRTTTRTVTATRATISEPVVASATRTVKGVKLGVVRLATFSLGAHGEVRDAVEHLLHRAPAESSSICAPTAAGSSRRHS